MPAFIRIAWKVIFDAVWHFSEDDGWAMASHVALSTLLAIFPFLIFGTALGSFLGADQFATTAVHFIFDTWPESIAKPISDEVVRVLTIPRGGLLTISVLAAAYFASNGVEALRVSLNRAYRVAESRPWYKTRVASLGFVLLACWCLPWSASCWWPCRSPSAMPEPICRGSTIFSFCSTAGALPACS